jgi:hypothetical protein
MPTSHYFPQNYKNNSSETNLIQDLVDEQIKLFGTDVYYINRKAYIEDFSNDIVYSEFKDKIVIEAMLQNVEGFGPQSEFISKFGLRVTDEITMTLSARRWDEEKFRLPGIEIISRPNEGDLIYLPLTGDLYEIKFVEREMPFYQLGKIYFYTMTCEIYQVGNDDIETGIDEIDFIESQKDQSLTLVLTEGGTGNYYVGDTVEYHTVTEVSGSPVYTATGITAEVAGWEGPTRTLKLINATGSHANNYAVLAQGYPTQTTETDGIYTIGTQETTWRNEGRYPKNDTYTLIDTVADVNVTYNGGLGGPDDPAGYLNFTFPARTFDDAVFDEATETFWIYRERYLADAVDLVEMENTSSEFEDNKYIEDAADGFLDFTETNPFGEYGNIGNDF